MSLRKMLGKLLLVAVVQLMGALSGTMTQEEVEKLMNIMHRTKVVHILRQEDE